MVKSLFLEDRSVTEAYQGLVTTLDKQALSVTRTEIRMLKTTEDD